MTVKEAAIVGTYTGYLLGSFSDMHAYIEEILGRPIFTHELVNKQVMEEMHEKSKKDFVGIEVK